jgi:hypothetical protein
VTRKRHRYYGAQHLHFITCSCFQRQPILDTAERRFYDFNVWSAQKQTEKVKYMHWNPVKRGLVERPEQWLWSSIRAYLYSETGPVRVRFQEWALEIKPHRFRVSKAHSFAKNANEWGGRPVEASCGSMAVRKDGRQPAPSLKNVCQQSCDFVYKHAATIDSGGALYNLPCRFDDCSVGFSLC